MFIEWGKVVLIMAAIFSLGLLGPIAACVAVAGTFLVSALAYVVAVGRTAGVPLPRLLAALARPLFCSGFVAVALVLLDRFAFPWLALAVQPRTLGVAALDRFFLPSWGAWVCLLLAAPAGAILYLGVTLAVARDQVREIVRLVRSSRNRKKEGAGDAAAA